MRILCPVLLLTACTVQPADPPADTNVQAVPEAASTSAATAVANSVGAAATQPVETIEPVDTAVDAASNAGVSAPVAVPEPNPRAIALIRAEWAKAPNRTRCAPLVLSDEGGARGTPRRATYSGGWAVAFGTPGVRSAYGIAGPGPVATDRADTPDQRARLAAQWPYFRELPALPRPSFAGYGLVGAEPYADDDPDGRGRQSLAYVRVAGQVCTYNVWSRLGRRHLETLLAGIRPLPRGSD